MYVRLQTWFGLVIGFNEHLQIVTTSNYSAIPNSHTQQVNTVHAKSSQSAVSSPVIVCYGFQHCTSLNFHVHVFTGWKLPHN
jgi:hypothetical protein